MNDCVLKRNYIKYEEMEYTLVEKNTIKYNQRENEEQSKT